MKKAKLLTIGGLSFLAISALTACGGGNPSTQSTSGGEKTSSGAPITSQRAGNHWEVASPNGKIVCYVTFTEGGGIYYYVTNNNTVVLEEQSLGFYTNEMNFGEEDYSLQLKGNPIVEKKNVYYENISGKSSIVDLDYSELALTTWDTFDFDFTVTFRVFDDGFGFNYGITREELEVGVNDKVTGTNEQTNIQFPKGTKFWTQNYKEIKSGSVHNCFAYEEDYTKCTLSGMNGNYVSLPFGAKVDKDNYITMQESGLIGSGFYGSMLAGNPLDEENTVFHLDHTPASVCLDKEEEFEVTLPFSSPWRVAAIGSAATIADTEIYEAILGDVEPYSPDPENPLNYEEFVNPGVAAWSWLRYHGNHEKGGKSRPWQHDFDLHNSYLDTAIELGYHFYLLDGGWDGSDELNKMPAFYEKAKAHGVHLLGWINAYKATNRTSFKTTMKRWKEMGIEGIKIDFFDGQTETAPEFQGEDKKMLETYRTVYEVCAELGMTVNCHGANKPTGERRMYPNVINREAIKGCENESRVNARSVINSMFTRAAVGPTDFTPTVIPFAEAFTSGALFASTVCFESGQTSAAGSNGYAGLTNEYQAAPVKKFYSNLPSRWDESHTISGDFDDHYCVARRNDTNWFVGGIARDAQSFTIKLDFLEEDKTYEALIISDGEDFGHYQSVTLDVSKNGTVSVDVLDNGGFAIELIEK